MEYLFAAYAVVWVALFMYLLILGGQINTLRRQLEEISRSDGEQAH